MVRKIKIAKHVISKGQPCFIIAEAGVNHNGDINLAMQLIDAAREAGADAVKFQTFTADKVVTRYAEKAKYQKKTTKKEESHYDLLASLELSGEAHRQLQNYATKQRIIFLSTPYDKASIDLLARLGVPALKISSADITNHPLLSHAASTRLPVILSTGMSTLGEIEDAVQVITGAGNKKLILLHCNFNYPARMEDINLRAMHTLQQAFGFPVGYSDHTMGFEVSLAAVAMGAVVIEKHFTMSRSLPGPDHRASLEPAELKNMIAGIRNIEKALGSSIKRPTGEEIPNRKVSRRSLVANIDIPSGTVIAAEILDTKRPGTGISPKHLTALVGRRAIRAIRKDELITWDKVR